MVACTYCGFENDEKNNFCRNCRKQIRCVSCKELLEADADMCFVCGSEINFRENHANQNTYELDEEMNEKTGRSKRKIRLSLSDSGLRNVAPALSALMGGSQIRSNPSQPNSRRIFQTSQANASPRILESSTTDEGDSQIRKPEVKTIDEGHNEQNDLLCFELDHEGNLFTRVDDFKGKPQSEQQRRFILLYILDYQSVFSEKPSDELIAEAAEKSGFYDKKNFRKYLGQIKADYFVPAGNILQPKDKLSSYLDLISSEMRDDLIKGTPMSVGKRTAKKRSSTATYTEEDKIKVKEINDKYPQIAQINSKDFSHKELSAVALYLLRKFENTESISMKALHGIISRTRSYGTEYRRYNDAVKRNGADYLHFKSDGTVSLTHEGEQAVEKILAEKGIAFQ